MGRTPSKFEKNVARICKSVTRFSCESRFIIVSDQHYTTLYLVAGISFITGLFDSKRK